MDNQQIQTKRPKPVLLVILDGWGITQPYSGNAVSMANTPVFNGLISRYPSMTLRASGEAVGLPWGKAGNSEVGHLNIGSGRIIYQKLPRINKAISDGKFYKNKALIDACEHVKKFRQSGAKLHLIGLVSNGCVHASFEHLQALMVLIKEQKVSEVYMHVILDGRDTPYNSGINFVKDLERSIAEYGVGKIATICGRFYAMDRNNHWDRIEKSYISMTEGVGNKSGDAVEAITKSYQKKIYDEEFIPTVITENSKPVALIESGDGVIFFNYRPDRAREITKSFILPGFNKFNRKEYLKNLHFVCFTEYEKNLPVTIAFSPETLNYTLGEVLASNNLKQMRIAETEKYAHVTYFFNGGKEIKSKGEDHILIPSPNVDSYDLKPEMSAFEVTDKILKAIEKEKYDFILVNFANPDMVGHTGNIKAAVKAIETVDKCLGKIVKNVLAKNGITFVVADHGNVEVMFNMQTGMVDKEHTANPVPFIAAGKQFEGYRMGSQDAPGGDLSLIQPQGILSDVAPTILKVMGLPKPKEMTGRSLI